MKTKKVVSLLILIILFTSSLCSCSNKSENFESDPKDLSFREVGVLTGSIHDTLLMEDSKDVIVKYFNSNTDLAMALEQGKIDAYVVDEPVSRVIINEYPNQYVLKWLLNGNYAYGFRKNNEKGSFICNQMNEFLRKCKKNGTLDEVDSIWFGTDEKAKIVDMENLPSSNGTLVLATSTDIGPPFTYIKDNKYVGYDIDIAVRFCREYGYGLEIVNSGFDGVLALVTTGKADFCACCISVTPERGEKVLFSDPNYVGGIVAVANSNDNIFKDEDIGFFDSIKESFERTFVREYRYKLFLSGIGTTLLIVVLSIIFGSIIGFLVYLIYYRSKKTFRRFVDAIIQVTENTPIVVILMIFYYLIFGNADISGTIVSIIGFTIVFAGSVISVMKVGVGAVDPVQREAALALGYTENKAFMRFILPQAMVHFLPGYKSAIIQLIKGTAIVGYIAVQDLTKVSDIVRSRTYEAFFPLIVSAIIYYLMAVIMSLLVKKIEIRINPAGRRKIKLLEGVERDD